VPQAQQRAISDRWVTCGCMLVHQCSFHPVLASTLLHSSCCVCGTAVSLLTMRTARTWQCRSKVPKTFTNVVAVNPIVVGQFNCRCIERQHKENENSTKDVGSAFSDSLTSRVGTATPTLCTAGEMEVIPL
jgi:hypothetical protein